jgi:signal transduction histidine kinase
MGLALARRAVESGAPKEEIDGSLERIKRETVRLNSLIEQLLQWTRLEGGSSQLPKETVQLDALLEDVVSDTHFEGQATRREVVLLRSAPCTVLGSPDLLRSALENILRNALRYSPPGTRIEASLDCISPKQLGIEMMPQKSSATALITIRDYGAGVPESELAEIFKPFYRVATSRDRQTGGVGLGLAITERAVRSHGGSIRARNAPGGGLQVEIRLPVQAI